MNIDNLTIAELRGMAELLADYQAKGIIYSQADLTAAIHAERRRIGEHMWFGGRTTQAGE